jgi:solute carrier family 25 citrate transporter 1
MSRNGIKKPVGFATHVIAGGIAGACEAVSRRLVNCLSNPNFLARSWRVSPSTP